MTDLIKHTEPTPRDAGDQSARRFRASTLEEAVEAAQSELGADIEYVQSSHLRRSGLSGFFAENSDVEIIASPAASPTSGTELDDDTTIDVEAPADITAFLPSDQQPAATRVTPTPPPPPVLPPVEPALPKSDPTAIDDADTKANLFNLARDRWDGRLVSLDGDATADDSVFTSAPSLPTPSSPPASIAYPAPSMPNMSDADMADMNDTPVDDMAPISMPENSEMQMNNLDNSLMMATQALDAVVRSALERADGASDAFATLSVTITTADGQTITASASN